MPNFPSGVMYTPKMMGELRGARSTSSFTSGTTTRRLEDLPDDIRGALRFLGFDQAVKIGSEILEKTRPDLFWSGRLQASGFLFVNGINIKESGGPITTRGKYHSSGGQGVIWPDAPKHTDAKDKYQIDVIWHTPVPVKKGRTFYMWKGSKWFDYALYKLETTHMMNMHTETIKIVRERVRKLADDALRNLTLTQYRKLPAAGRQAVLQAHFLPPTHRFPSGGQRRKAVI